GMEQRQYVYEMNFPAKMGEDKSFVEHLWARRKVGYLLDQIRLNGEKKELVDEVVALAKKYSIATPYTSYLIVPDAGVPVAGGGVGRGAGGAMLGPRVPPGLEGASAGSPVPVADFARRVQSSPAAGAGSRAKLEEEKARKPALEVNEKRAVQQALDKK